MSGTVLVYSGSIIILIWGAAHLFPTIAIVRGFGSISEDNRRNSAVDLPRRQSGVSILRYYRSESSAYALMIFHFGIAENHE